MLKQAMVVAGALVLTLAPDPSLAAKKPPPNTLTVRISGLPAGKQAAVRIKGPGGFEKRVRVAAKKTLKRLDAGRYRLRTKATAGYSPTRTTAKAKVTARRGARVTFRFRAPAPPPTPAPAPPAVSGLALETRTAFGLTLRWTNPTRTDLERIIVRRSAGQTPPVSVNNGTNVSLSDDTAESAGDSGLEPTTDYSYAVFARYRDGTTSAATTLTSRTLPLGDLDSGGSHTCAIDWTGKPWCWGTGAAQGYGGTASNQQPVAVDTSGALSGVLLTKISGGGAHTCALSDAGRVFCWGVNGSGQVGDGSVTTATRPVAIEGALSGKRIVALSAGQSHTCAVDADGQVYCWGSNGSGRLGDGTTTQRPTPTPITGGALAGRRIVDISAGSQSTCAVDSQGGLVCWGANAYGEFGNGTKTPSPTPLAIPLSGALAGKQLSRVSVADVTTCAVDRGASAYCWGLGGAGRLGNGGVADSLVPVAVTSTGALPAGGVAGVDSGYQRSCAVSTSGLASCWGYNGNGQLGDGTSVQRLSPAPVVTSGALSGQSLTAVSTGDFFTCSLAHSGHAYCWGYGPYLGDGTGTQSPVPVRVLGFGP